MTVTYFLSNGSSLIVEDLEFEVTHRQLADEITKLPYIVIKSTQAKRNTVLFTKNIIGFTLED